MTTTLPPTKAAGPQKEEPFPLPNRGPPAANFPFPFLLFYYFNYLTIFRALLLLCWQPRKTEEGTQHGLLLASASTAVSPRVPSAPTAYAYSTAFWPPFASLPLVASAAREREANPTLVETRRETPFLSSTGLPTLSGPPKAKAPFLARHRSNSSSSQSSRTGQQASLCFSSSSALYHFVLSPHP